MIGHLSFSELAVNECAHRVRTDHPVTCVKSIELRVKRREPKIVVLSQLEAAITLLLGVARPAHTG
jgi:hypothetical protein